MTVTCVFCILSKFLNGQAVISYSLPREARSQTVGGVFKVMDSIEIEKQVSFDSCWLPSSNWFRCLPLPIYIDERENGAAEGTTTRSN